MKKVLSLVLAAVLAFSSVPAVLAATFTDEAKWPSSVSWAKDEIHYMADKGILVGDEKGAFLPADPVTRAQFIKMIVETFGLTKTAAVTYSDVPSTAWFYPYVQKAVAQGFLLNYGSALNPNGELTRQEAAALLARYLALDESKKVSSSTYKDFDSIKIKYQDYVLQATYEGLFNGDDSGNFSPDRVLRRCEAAAILYRAAGTIYRASATGTDTAAADENAVITKSGTTVSSAKIDGKLYITEGASGGTVTLSECDVETLIIRATSSLILSDCKIDEIIVDSATANYTADITVIGSTDIGKMTAESPVEMSLSSRSTVDELTITSDAKKSAVTGSGTVASVKVNATGFTSEKMPGKYTIASGISAVFAGVTYSGASADTSASGFTTAPTVYATSVSTYVTAKPSVGGFVYYYFTNTATAPTKANFFTQYGTAAVKNNFAISANVSFDKEVGKTADTSGYSYIAMMVYKSDGTTYQPVLLSNKSTNGFAGTPAMSVSGSYDQITLTTTLTGTVYYYYASTSTVPTAQTYMTLYNASAYRGTVSATANVQKAQITVLSTSVTNYPYVVLMIKDQSGNSYQPTVISRSGSPVDTMDTGFSTTPFANTNNDSAALGFVAKAAGTVDYYYTNTSTLPTSAQFTTNLAATAAKGSITAQQNVSYYDTLENQTYAKSYKYLVLRLTAAGVTYQPVLVTLPSLGSTSLTGTGFTTMPSTSMTGGYFYLSVSATSAGTLYYYITDNSTAPSVSAFETNYANKTSQYLELPSGGSATLQAGTRSIKTTIVNEIGVNSNYIVLMAVIGGVKMTPIVVPLVGGSTSTDPVQPTTNGFVSTPTYAVLSSRAHQITLKTTVPGTVYYYYTDNPTVPSAEEIKAIVEAEMSVSGGQSGSYAGVQPVLTANRNATISIQIVNNIVSDYVVLMLVGANDLNYLPIVIPTSGTTSGGTTPESAADAGFVTRPTAKLTGTTLTLSYNAVAAGSVMYYFTTVPTVPVDAATFLGTYFNMTGNMRGSLDVAMGSGTKTLTAPTGYTYLVLMLQKSNVTVGTTAYCQPIVVPITGASGGTVGFYGTPYVKNDLLNYYPIMTGTLVYYFTNESNLGDFSSSLENMQQAAVTGGTVQITSTGAKTMNIKTATLLGDLVTNFEYVVIWINAGTVTTDPIFVPLSDSSSGTGGGSALSAGFSSAPDLNGVLVYFTANVSGTVKYFYTNSTKQYSNAEFTATYPYQVQMGIGGAMPVAKDRTTFIDTTVGSSYKYIWIMLDTGSSTYTPVCVQLR